MVISDRTNEWNKRALACAGVDFVKASDLQINYEGPKAHISDRTNELNIMALDYARGEGALG